MAPEGTSLLDGRYLPRVVDAEVAAGLRAMPAVVLEGPRACGKTSTGREHSYSEVMFGSDPSARTAAQVEPAELLAGPEPRLLDEWQLAPQVWNQVRAACDDGRRPGRFILTGSAVPADDITRHSGAGRVMRIRMRPMSLLETGLSTGEVSMADLFDAGARFADRPSAGLRDLVEAACRGGWPGCVHLDTAAAQAYAASYLQEVCRADIALLGGPARDPVGVERLLRSLARNVSTEASQRTLASDTGGDHPMDPRTAGAYLDALRRVFVVEDVPAWSVELRSRARLRRAAKRHLVDPSLAVAALDGGPQRLWGDLPAFGLLFESMAVRDLRVYAPGGARTHCPLPRQQRTRGGRHHRARRRRLDRAGDQARRRHRHQQRRTVPAQASRHRAAAPCRRPREPGRGNGHGLRLPPRRRRAGGSPDRTGPLNGHLRLSISGRCRSALHISHLGHVGDRPH